MIRHNEDTASRYEAIHHATTNECLPKCVMALRWGERFRPNQAKKLLAIRSHPAGHAAAVRWHAPFLGWWHLLQSEKERAPAARTEMKMFTWVWIYVMVFVSWYFRDDIFNSTKNGTFKECKLQWQVNATQLTILFRSICAFLIMT